ncbi:Mammalian cell entry related domain protein [Thioalkalivibrio sulfidiphilus HL-EbGr7]|uniref:Mammalian cell entry related domain protein n=1 Tax=Thioalkalivibrio sulfidiphilus (strain HL-EbGR7) TaxID=396588 RepID=B8GMJ9_THISH|nr:outer membrane lipid asymmetry maintenance protein MlaD [Thioalkalivibrio sulfidiphilus]ACL71831.1 Mammalian cell entry related domain protein [Thioalkalivibrio sulfidiphilus HL-EbGr7]
MTTRTIEITVGIFVALGVAALFMLAMQVSNISEYRNSDGYTVSAYFTNIGGLKVRAPVTVSGVRVGRVTAIRYDPERYQARVEITIGADHDYLPTDTQASIYTAGLLGEQYIALEPGGEDEVLAQGGEIHYTQSAFVLEQIIGRIMVNMTTN